MLVDAPPSFSAAMIVRFLCWVALGAHETQANGNATNALPTEDKPAGLSAHLPEKLRANTANMYPWSMHLKLLNGQLSKTAIARFNRDLMNDLRYLEGALPLGLARLLKYWSDLEVAGGSDDLPVLAPKELAEIGRSLEKLCR
jgi:hypothetical protein